MPQCVFKSCKNNHRNINVSDGISYFRFPVEPLRRGKWISIVAEERQEAFFRPKKYAVVCSMHFEKNDIIGNSHRSRLSKRAVPKFQVGAPRAQVPSDKQINERLVSSGASSSLSDYKTEPCSEADDIDSDTTSSKYEIEVQGSWKKPTGCEGPATSSPGPSRKRKKMPRDNGARATDRVSEVRCEVTAYSEFDMFGKSIAAQLSNMPLEDTLELMQEIQELISRKRLHRLRLETQLRQTATQLPQPAVATQSLDYAQSFDPPMDLLIIKKEVSVE